MYCKKCGKEIDSDSVFCAYCGSGQKDSKEYKKQELVKETQQKKYLTKEFDFGYFDNNDKAIREINKWMVDKSINFIGINIDTKFTNFPISETSMRQVTIVYEEIETCDYRYQIGAETYSNIFFENSHKRVKRKFEKWKSKNQDKTVVWNELRSHDYLYNNWVSNVASLYYVFKEKRDESVYRKRMKKLESNISLSNSIMRLLGALFIIFFLTVLGQILNL